MLLQINYKSGKPVYLQLVDQIKAATASGALQPGEALPSIRPLAEELRVNRNTVAKAYSGLDDAEILKLDRWIRAHTLERFGPVRSVEALQVFELGFEAVNRSKRYKSGIAVRFPRILRWRHDKPAAEADALAALQALAR